MNTITPDEAASLAGLSRNSILKALKDGKIYGYQSQSRQWSVSRRSVVDFIRKYKARKSRK